MQRSMVQSPTAARDSIKEDFHEQRLVYLSNKHLSNGSRRGSPYAGTCAPCSRPGYAVGCGGMPGTCAICGGAQRLHRSSKSMQSDPALASVSTICCVLSYAWRALVQLCLCKDDASGCKSVATYAQHLRNGHRRPGDRRVRLPVLLLLLLLLLLLAELLLLLQVGLHARRHRRPAIRAVLHDAHIAHARAEAVHRLVNRHGVWWRPVLRHRRHTASVRLLGMPTRKCRYKYRAEYVTSGEKSDGRLLNNPAPMPNDRKGRDIDGIWRSGGTQASTCT